MNSIPESFLLEFIRDGVLDNIKKLETIPRSDLLLDNCYFRSNEAFIREKYKSYIAEATKSKNESSNLKSKINSNNILNSNLNSSLREIKKPESKASDIKEDSEEQNKFCGSKFLNKKIGAAAVKTDSNNNFIKNKLSNASEASSKIKIKKRVALKAGNESANLSAAAPISKQKTKQILHFESIAAASAQNSAADFSSDEFDDEEDGEEDGEDEEDLDILNSEDEEFSDCYEVEDEEEEEEEGDLEEKSAESEGKIRERKEDKNENMNNNANKDEIENKIISNQIYNKTNICNNDNVAKENNSKKNSKDNLIEICNLNSVNKQTELESNNDPKVEGDADKSIDKKKIYLFEALEENEEDNDGNADDLASKEYINFSQFKRMYRNSLRPKISESQNPQTKQIKIEDIVYFIVKFFGCFLFTRIKIINHYFLNYLIILQIKLLFFKLKSNLKYEF